MVMDEDKDASVNAAINAQALHDAALTVRPVRADGTVDESIDAHEAAMLSLDETLRALDDVQDDVDLGLDLGGEQPRTFVDVNAVLDALMRSDSPRRTTEDEMSDALHGFHDEPSLDTTNEVAREAVLDAWELPRVERWFVHLRPAAGAWATNRYEDAMQARVMALLTEHLREGD